MSKCKKVEKVLFSFSLTWEEISLEYFSEPFQCPNLWNFLFLLSCAIFYIIDHYFLKNSLLLKIYFKQTKQSKNNIINAHVYQLKRYKRSVNSFLFLSQIIMFNQVFIIPTLVFILLLITCIISVSIVYNIHDYRYNKYIFKQCRILAELFQFSMSVSL